MRIIALFNRKGGTAKTTSAVNIAGRLAQHLLPEGKRVLLIDLDPQGSITTALGVDPEGRCISRLLTGDSSFRDTLLPADRAASGGPSRPNLFIIPASDRLQTAVEELLIRSFARRNRGENGYSVDKILRLRLQDVVHHFEYVIVDCPPSLGALDQAVYDFVDEAIVPVKMAYLDTTGAKYHMDDILEAQGQGADIRISLVVPTFFRPQEILARQVYLRLRRLYGNLLADPIPQSVAIEKSQAAGQRTIFEYAPDSKPALAYDRLVTRILNNGR